MKDLAILIPSRSRPQSIISLLEALGDTNTRSDVIVVIDDDDPYKESYLDIEVTTMIVYRDGKGMARPLNKAASFLAWEYRHFAFLGDDHRPRTFEWDRLFIEELDAIETGIVYGNDLFMKEALPTAVAMTGDIVRALDGMVPKGMIHLYLDNFWLTLGRDLESISYMPDVIIEHLHPAAGKAEWDDQYKEVNASDIYIQDLAFLEEYLASQSYADLLEQLR